VYAKQRDARLVCVSSCLARRAGDVTNDSTSATPSSTTPIGVFGKSAFEAVDRVRIEQRDRSLRLIVGDPCIGEFFWHGPVPFVWAQEEEAPQDIASPLDRANGTGNRVREQLARRQRHE
jgi:hypothetical protein